MATARATSPRDSVIGLPTSRTINWANSSERAASASAAARSASPRAAAGSRAKAPAAPRAAATARSTSIPPDGATAVTTSSGSAGLRLTISAALTAAGASSRRGRRTRAAGAAHRRSAAPTTENTIRSRRAPLVVVRRARSVSGRVPGPTSMVALQAMSEYDPLAEAFDRYARHNAFNAHYDRPAVLSLAGEVRGLRVLDARSEEHTSELQSRQYLVCRLLLEKKK